MGRTELTAWSVGRRCSTGFVEGWTEVWALQVRYRNKEETENGIGPEAEGDSDLTEQRIHMGVGGAQEDGTQFQKASKTKQKRMKAS